MSNGNPPNEPCPCSWTQKAQAIAIVIGACVAGLGGLGAFITGLLNNAQINEARGVQTRQVQQAEEVRETLDSVTAKTDAKLRKIEATTTETAKTVDDTAGLQLFNVWKNLEWVAYNSDKPDDIAKAKEAKIAYETYLRQKPRK